MVRLNGSSSFQTLHQWCEITPFPQRLLPPILSDKSSHSCQWEPDLIILPPAEGGHTDPHPRPHHLHCVKANVFRWVYMSPHHTAGH